MDALSMQRSDYPVEVQDEASPATGAGSIGWEGLVDPRQEV